MQDPKYGKCAHCNEDNSQPAWCLRCDPDITTRWTSRNKDVDDCMKTFQRRARKYEDAIEWIPFDRLSDVKEIGKGGFGSVYKAIWSDGTRKIDGNDYNYVRVREPCSIVALKTLSYSKENHLGFLQEFKSLMECKTQQRATSLAIYGITQNTETNEYMMVFQYVNNGCLHKYLRKNFSEFTWKIKLKMLIEISRELTYIHQANYIHADFHSGNILIGRESHIADLGLSRKNDENVLEGDIYGVMPYVAPEVLLGEQKFTQAADVYGLGIIMAEITTGQRPYDGRKFDAKLGADICRGLRPKFAPGTPKCYIEFVETCIHSDPQKRPIADDVLNMIFNWYGDVVSPNDNEIKKQFLEADKVIKSLPISKHPDEMYTSKIISTKLISDAIKDLSQVDSAQRNLDITKID